MRALFCLLAWICLAVPAAAQTLRPNVDYRIIAQQPVNAGERIEVIDFFFYACPFCNELAPILDRWTKTKPGDVAFFRVPAVRRDSWLPLAKTYYALEALGEAERLHLAVFRGYHTEQLAMSQEAVMADWAQKQGIDRDRFLGAYRSEEVARKAERARELTQRYAIEGTPSLAVGGRYVTDGDLAGSIPQMIPLLDAMIRMAREQRPEKAK